MPKPIDPHQWPCACSALRMASRAVSRHYEAILAPTGTTTTQYAILRHLQRSGPTALRLLADALLLERTSLYRAIAPLQRDGLIVVRDHPDDGRVKRAHLTRTGLARIRQVLPHWRRAQASLLAAVGPEVWGDLARRLDRLRATVAADPLLQGRTGR